MKTTDERLPDMSATLASMGRGSLQARIMKLERALAKARHGLILISGQENELDGYTADHTLDQIDEILAEDTYGQE